MLPTERVLLLTSCQKNNCQEHFIAIHKTSIDTTYDLAKCGLSVLKRQVYSLFKIKVTFLCQLHGGLPSLYCILR